MKSSAIIFMPVAALRQRIDCNFVCKIIKLILKLLNAKKKKKKLKNVVLSLFSGWLCLISMNIPQAFPLVLSLNITRCNNFQTQ